jgi:hypothetical protein
MIELKPYEKKEVDWWCHHHKMSAQYLTTMWRRYLQAIEDSDQQASDQLLSMIHAQLPAFESEYTR